MRVYQQVIAIAICIALAGCGSGSSTAPVISNISGDYTGTVQDSQSGSGTAAATFAQTGSSAGGTIVDTEASGAVNIQVSLKFTSATAANGAMVIDFQNGTTCSFSTNASYNSATNVLSGSYTAVTNCTGDTGTFSLTQQCIDTPASSDRRKIATLPPRC